MHLSFFKKILIYVFSYFGGTMNLLLTTCLFE